MGLLINIDNGGTLTDFCAVEGIRIHRTKTVTTPYDLSKCLFEGLDKLSRQLYGEDDLQRLLLATDHIRYSTTQGTNALVERKGPRLGLLLSGPTAGELRSHSRDADLFDALVGDRVIDLPVPVADRDLDRAATRAINDLAAAGATRVIVGAGGPTGATIEHRLQRLLLGRFPSHLLGAIPILYSHQLVRDQHDARRIWTAVFNAFLHPAMERFLYSTEQRLREFKTRNRLLVFRNDGAASRIARTAAIKTYSSGPRGGAEAGRAYAHHYGFRTLVGIDVGGTTVDISVVRSGQIDVDAYGRIEGIETSIPLAAIESVGVGGSSIMRVSNGQIVVGPDSVGGVPGPACFGLGGTDATITDAFLAAGLLDCGTFFGGELRLDAARALEAIQSRVAQPLGLDLDAAIRAMEQAWIDKIAAAVQRHVQPGEETVLAAFGGAGPLVVSRIAEQLGITRVLIPGVAALFSAFGVGFSDMAHDIDLPLDAADEATVLAARQTARERLERAMFSEGVDLSACHLDERIEPLPTTEAWPVVSMLRARATFGLPRATITGRFGQQRPGAYSSGARLILGPNGRVAHPLLRLADQTAGARGAGPAVIEDAYFTCRVDRGWRYEIDSGGDVLLSRGE